MLCHSFRHDPQFFVSLKGGPQAQPKKTKAHDLIIDLRKQNHSVYEIADALKERSIPLSATAVREMLRAEGFAPLPRRLDEERGVQVGPSVEPVADARSFGLVPGSAFVTCCGELFLFGPCSSPTRISSPRPRAIRSRPPSAPRRRSKSPLAHAPRRHPGAQLAHPVRRPRLDHA
ncbi:MAG: hypothetical protein KGJ55_04600 [Gammaproteobacteria bacterium]|nr:hypothetical protein [Gammaproteobacteria bacterium]